MSKAIPSILRESIGYHAYWRSFKDSNSDGVGDLEGIRQQLSYICRDLGANTLYINPFNPSHWYDGGYDVINYEDVAPVAGTLETAQSLIDDAHALGMRVIFDLVPNHSSHLNPWFQESASSVHSPRRNWYIWKKGRSEGGPPNNWLSIINTGEKNSAWAFDSRTGEYYLHTFLPQQPDLNWRNPAVRARMYEVIRFWFRMGVDGLRIDAVFWLGKDPDFRDEPPNPDYREGRENPWNSLLHIYSMGHPDMYRYLEEMAEVASEFPGRFIIPETLHDADFSHVTKFYQHCKGFGAPFNFNLIARPLDASIITSITNFQATLGPDDVPIYVLGNHDRPRVATRVGGEKRARLAAMLLLTLPGFPLIYYGDELGMKNVAIPPDRIQDPHGKYRPELGRNRDGERTPMQWDGSENAGFTTGEPWLPIGEDYEERNVKKQMSDGTSIWTLHHELIQLRKKAAEMAAPGFQSIEVGERPVVAYLRPSESGSSIVLLNFSDETQTVALNYGVCDIALSTGLDRQESRLDFRKAALRPAEGLICVLPD